MDTKARTLRKMNDLDVDLFSQLCDYYWHKTTGEPENGVIDTSPECRSFAVKVMSYIDLITGKVE